jgi:hypothetical protein
MPTKIILIDDENNEVGMTTEDFATYRLKIGVEEFEYDGHNIIGFAENPFRYFGVMGDKQFIIDSLISPIGPAWNDFVEAINGGSIFAIITARGHTPSILKESVYNLIISNKNGLDSNELIKNLEKFRDLADKEKLSKKDLIRDYLDMCRFYPVTYGKGSATNPEEGKVIAMKEFINYIKEVSNEIHKKAFLKNKVSNRFIPQLGFSDDDTKNLKVMKKHFEDEPMLKMYSTKGGEKKKFN